MEYLQKEVDGSLADTVKWFWTIASDDPDSQKQKIIPDGYPEIIFHYGDPYEVNISGSWEKQSQSLLAGQLSSFFYLRNTGVSRMFAIKLQPWTLHALFEISAVELLDRVIDVPEQKIHPIWKKIYHIATSEHSFERKCLEIEDLLSEVPMNVPEPTQNATKKILEKNGLVNIHELAGEIGAGERTLERQFQTHIGLSPKKYSRIIRHSYIFRIVNEKPNNWAQVAYQAGFYDQTHFIRDFQEFTGEDPSKYGFDEKNMANFFLK